MFSLLLKETSFDFYLIDWSGRGISYQGLFEHMVKKICYLYQKPEAHVSTVPYIGGQSQM